MMTKKLLGILLATFIAVSALFTLIACTPNNKSEVKLLGITGTNSLQTEANATTNNGKMFAALSAPIFADVDTDTNADETEPETPTQTDEELDVYSDYTIIYKTQTTLYFTIKLSNPRNYYILDFRLSCEQEDVEVKQGTHYSKINDANTYIRWDEATDRIGNHTATFELKLPNADISPDKIKILDMYYSDRTDGTNKTSVNMNNKETYTVYKIDEPVKMSDRKNNFTEFSFKLDKIEGAVVKSVKVDDVEYTADESGVYKIPGGELVVAYEYRINDEVVYEKEIREEIELLRWEKSKQLENSENASWLVTEYGTVEVLILFSGTDVGNSIIVKLSDTVQYILEYDSVAGYYRCTSRNDTLGNYLD